MARGPALVKTTFLLNKWGHDKHSVHFLVATEDWTDFRSVTIPLGTWADMGSPATVTVTIEPGDMLNG